MPDKVKELLKEILNKNSTMMLAFAITDMFYISFMFLIYVMPIEITAGFSVVAGGIISSIITHKICAVPGKETMESLAGKLCYFPVDKASVRKAQYSLVFKITGIQLLLTLIPIVVMSFQFNLQHALMALFCTAFMMLASGTYFIEMNLISYKRK